MTEASKEIREPVGSIVMAAKALVRGGLSPEDLGQVISVLESQSERLVRALDNWLELSRSKEEKPSREPVSSL